METRRTLSIVAREALVAAPLLVALISLGCGTERRVLGTHVEQPVLSSVLPQVAGVGSTTTFRVQVEGADPSSLDYHWDFGQAVDGQAAPTSHQPSTEVKLTSTAGVYQCSVWAEPNESAEASGARAAAATGDRSQTLKFQLSVPGPTAINRSKEDPGSGDTVTFGAFNDVLDLAVYDALWDFGGGAEPPQAVGFSPTVTVLDGKPDATPYTGKLTLVRKGGSGDSISQDFPFTVQPLEIDKDSIAPQEVTSGATVTFQVRLMHGTATGSTWWLGGLAEQSPQVSGTLSLANVKIIAAAGDTVNDCKVVVFNKYGAAECDFDVHVR